MAKTLSPSEVKRLQEASERKEAAKLASQQKQGKDFVNNGQGVIPEAVWKSLPGKVEEQ